MTMKNPIVQHMLVAMTLVLVLGALSIIWPTIIAFMLGVFLLFHSFGVEQDIAGLSWTEVSNVPIVFASLRRPGLLAIHS